MHLSKKIRLLGGTEQAFVGEVPFLAEVPSQTEWDYSLKPRQKRRAYFFPMSSVFKRFSNTEKFKFELEHYFNSRKDQLESLLYTRKTTAVRLLQMFTKKLDKMMTNDNIRCAFMGRADRIYSVDLFTLIRGLSYYFDESKSTISLSPVHVGFYSLAFQYSHPDSKNNLISQHTCPICYCFKNKIKVPGQVLDYSVKSGSRTYNVIVTGYDVRTQENPSSDEILQQRDFIRLAKYNNPSNPNYYTHWVVNCHEEDIDIMSMVIPFKDDSDFYTHTAHSYGCKHTIECVSKEGYFSTLDIVVLRDCQERLRLGNIVRKMTLEEKRENKKQLSTYKAFDVPLPYAKVFKSLRSEEARHAYNLLMAMTCQGNFCSDEPVAESVTPRYENLLAWVIGWANHSGELITEYAETVPVSHVVAKSAVDRVVTATSINLQVRLPSHSVYEMVDDTKLMRDRYQELKAKKSKTSSEQITCRDLHKKLAAVVPKKIVQQFFGHSGMPSALPRKDYYCQGCMDNPAKCAKFIEIQHKMYQHPSNIEDCDYCTDTRLCCYFTNVKDVGLRKLRDELKKQLDRVDKNKESGSMLESPKSPVPGGEHSIKLAQPIAVDLSGGKSWFEMSVEAEVEDLKVVDQPPKSEAEVKAKQYVDIIKKVGNVTVTSKVPTVVLDTMMELDRESISEIEEDMRLLKDERVMSLFVGHDDIRISI